LQYFTRKFEKNQRWNLHAGEDAFAAAALSFQPYGASGRYAMRFAKVFLTWPAPHTGLERSLNFVNHSINTGIKFKKYRRKMVIKQYRHSAVHQDFLNRGTIPSENLSVHSYLRRRNRLLLASKGSEMQGLVNGISTNCFTMTSIIKVMI